MELTETSEFCGLQHVIYHTSPTTSFDIVMAGWIALDIGWIWVGFSAGFFHA
jgi:hypothetical protein